MSKFYHHIPALALAACLAAPIPHNIVVAQTLPSVRELQQRALEQKNSEQDAQRAGDEFRQRTNAALLRRTVNTITNQINAGVKFTGLDDSFRSIRSAISYAHYTPPEKLDLVNNDRRLGTFEYITVRYYIFKAEGAQTAVSLSARVINGPGSSKPSECQVEVDARVLTDGSAAGMIVSGFRDQDSVKRQYDCDAFVANAPLSNFEVLVEAAIRTSFDVYTRR